MGNSIPIDADLLQTHIERDSFPNASIQAFSYNCISLTQFMTSLQICSPPVKEYRNGIFLDWLEEQNIDLWIDQVGDIREVEIVLNRITLIDFFRSIDLEKDCDFSNNVAACIGEMWRNNIDLPVNGKIFVGIDRDYRMNGPSVYFYSVS
jgi:hypothetical protein